MNAHVRIAAAILIPLAVLTGCSREVTGTVAMTTQPGSESTSRTPSTPRTTSRTAPRTPTLPSFPSAPGTPNPDAPPDSLTMTCQQYIGKDAKTQAAVVGAILGQDGVSLPPEFAQAAKILADAMCPYMPTSTVKDVMLGGALPKPR